MSILVDSSHRIAEDGDPLVPGVDEITKHVLCSLAEEDRQVVEIISSDIGGEPNIEALLTRVRRLSEAIGGELVHGLNGAAYRVLADRMCEAIGETVSSRLPLGRNAFSEIVSWISGTQRTHAVEIFTPNYDLLLEEAFERSRVPFFDGFTGSHLPFFEPASVLLDELPARWARLWKLHGSLGWERQEAVVTRTGRRDATSLIYPDHLKYDEVTKLPYSALFERLRNFVTTPDTMIICSGFSFRDSHVCAVLDEGLAANAHTSLLAFQYEPLEKEDAAVRLATRRPNVSVYARDGAVISGVPGPWSLGEPLSEEWREIRRTFWQEDGPESSGEFVLGDFSRLAGFLALTQAQRLQPVASNGEPAGTPHLDGSMALGQAIA
jgi:hypothetical protein